MAQRKSLKLSRWKLMQLNQPKTSENLKFEHFNLDIILSIRQKKKIGIENPLTRPWHLYDGSYGNLKN
jgi:hypothetical protein